jgi:hypothetical protein
MHLVGSKLIWLKTAKTRFEVELVDRLSIQGELVD